MNLTLKTATKQETKLVQDFFAKNLTKDNPWITNEEFLCPFWVEWAINRKQVVILKYEEEIVWALRFYPRKRDNIVSVYQFALDERFRWKWLIKKMLEKTWYKVFEVNCFSDSSFNEYYKKTWWELKSDDGDMKIWGIEI